MDVPVQDVIMTCMNLGLMVTINQRLDMETMIMVADEFEIEIHEEKIEELNLLISELKMLMIIIMKIQTSTSNCYCYGTC